MASAALAVAAGVTAFHTGALSAEAFDRLIGYEGPPAAAAAAAAAAAGGEGADRSSAAALDAAAQRDRAAQGWGLESGGGAGGATDATRR